MAITLLKILINEIKKRDELTVIEKIPNLTRKPTKGGIPAIENSKIENKKETEELE